MKITGRLIRRKTERTFERNPCVAQGSLQPPHRAPHHRGFHFRQIIRRQPDRPARRWKAHPRFIRRPSKRQRLLTEHAVAAAILKRRIVSPAIFKTHPSKPRRLQGLGHRHNRQISFAQRNPEPPRLGPTRRPRGQCHVIFQMRTPRIPTEHADRFLGLFKEDRRIPVVEQRAHRFMIHGRQDFCHFGGREVLVILEQQGHSGRRGPRSRRSQVGRRCFPPIPAVCWSKRVSPQALRPQLAGDLQITRQLIRIGAARFGIDPQIPPHQVCTNFRKIDWIVVLEKEVRPILDADIDTTEAQVRRLVDEAMEIGRALHPASPTEVEIVQVELQRWRPRPPACFTVLARFHAEVIRVGQHRASQFLSMRTRRSLRGNCSVTTVPTLSLLSIPICPPCSRMMR